MNPAPDYSAAYVVLTTDAGDGHEGHGFVFTTGRGNDIQTVAIRALSSWSSVATSRTTLNDLGDLGRELTGDAQLRWLGPEKGVVHMAAGAVLNALWDLRAKRAGKPLWKLLSGLSPEEIVDLVDFRYLSDALTRDEALAILRTAEPGRAARTAAAAEHGIPRLHDDPGLARLRRREAGPALREAVEDGFRLIKLKVGRDLERTSDGWRIARAAVGPDIAIAVDANQRWEVAEAIDWIDKLAEFDPYWIEEPTSPDDVLGHAAIRAGVAPVLVATGEHVANRVVFKQMLAAGSLDIVQIDATRVGGVNENIAILLLAAKFGVRVCPHAGGVGLCELVRHLSMFDLVAVSGSSEGRVIEYVDHLHEHFVDPAAHPARALRRPDHAGVQQPDAPSHPRGLPVPRRTRMDDSGDVVMTETRAARYVGGHAIDVAAAARHAARAGRGPDRRGLHRHLRHRPAHPARRHGSARHRCRRCSATRCPDAIAEIGPASTAGRSATRSR